jgi:hypothetical protein
MKREFFAVAAAMIVSISGKALAEPSLVVVQMGVSDISADGNTVCGTAYDAASERYVIVKWTRGVGTTLTSARLSDGQARMSDDGSIISYGDYNTENLNNSTNSITYGSAEGWKKTDVSHFWTAALGSVNMGPASNGYRCDFDINSPYDISGNGRYIVGGGWTNGLCGPFRGFRYDVTTRTYLQLPITLSAPPASTPSRAVRANSVSNDGRVICGYDDNYESTLTYQTRRAVVWERNAANTAWTTTILDRNGGEAYTVSGDGTCVFGQMSEATMQSTFGTNVRSAVRWKKTGSVWTPINLAGPSAYISGSSLDGNTAVGGNAVWKLDENGGIANDLLSYLAAHGASYPGLDLSFMFSGARGVSADGNAISLSLTNNNQPCLTTTTVGIFYPNGVPCEPPRMILDPVSDTGVVVRPGYYSYGIILNVFASGSYPLEYSWQKQSDTGEWISLETEDNCFEYAAANYDVKDIHGPQLRLGFLSNIWQGNYRCAISNSCGTIFSNPATISAPFCPADFNADGGVDGADVETFFQAWEAGMNSADVNQDGGIDGGDVETFFTYWEAGGC